MISERSRSQREHNCRPDGSANLLPRCANSMRDQKLRLRKFAGLAAIAAMLVLSGRAAERDIDDLLLVATVTAHSTFCRCDRPQCAHHDAT
jgi:hypothetical protein